MKIKEYIDKLNAVEKFERAQPQQPQSKNYKMVWGTDVFGGPIEWRVRITCMKLPLGTSNFRSHANHNFEIEHQLILNEKRRIGLP